MIWVRQKITLLKLLPIEKKNNLTIIKIQSEVDSIQKGKPQYGEVDLVKSRIHNSSQKYTIASL